MKNLHAVRLVTYAVVMALPLWFGSCKKGGDDAVTPTSSSVVGNWKITGMKVNPALDAGPFGKIDDFYKLLVDFGAETCLKELTLTINSNGTTSANNPQSCQSADDQLEEVSPVGSNGKWTLNGNKLTITNADNTVESYDVTLSGNTMTLVRQQPLEDANGKPVTTTMTMTLTRA